MWQKNKNTKKYEKKQKNKERKKERHKNITKKRFKSFDMMHCCDIY